MKLTITILLAVIAIAISNVDSHYKNNGKASDSEGQLRSINILTDKKFKEKSKGNYMNLL